MENMENLEVTNNEEVVIANVNEDILTISDNPTAGLSQIIEDVVEPEIIEEIVETKGAVTGCSKLFVRTEPIKNANPAGVINENDKVTIDLKNSTEEYYKVLTNDGLEGYCLKTYIEIK